MFQPVGTVVGQELHLEDSQIRRRTAFDTARLLKKRFFKACCVNHVLMGPKMDNPVEGGLGEQLITFNYELARPS